MSRGYKGRFVSSANLLARVDLPPPVFPKTATFLMSTLSLDRYIKVQDVFARSELRVERNGGFISTIRLHKNNIRAARCSDFLEFHNQRCRDALPPMSRCDSQIIDVDLAPFLLEFWQLVGRDAAHDFEVLQCRERDEGVTAKQALEVGSAGPCTVICFHVVERLAEDLQHRFHPCDVVGREPVYAERGSGRHSDIRPECCHTNGTSPAPA